MGISNKVDVYFKISERGSTICTELRAGLASFLTLSYLLLVNPQIMHAAGVPYSDAVFGTAASAGVSNIILGIFANLPFGLAPGLGLSAYLAYGVVLSGVGTLQECMSACFATGALLILCALVGLTSLIMAVVPKYIKLGIVVGMGALIALIGMVSVELVVANEKTLVTLGDVMSPDLLVVFTGIILVGTLVYHNFKGGILLGISILTLYFWIRDSSYPTNWVDVPNLEGRPSELLEMSALIDTSRASVVYSALGALLFITIFDISGVVFGLGTLGGLVNDDGTVDNSIWVFLAAGIGTIIAAMTGSTPLIVGVESASGVKEGGRTGLTSITIGVLFLISTFLSPLFGSVPPAATAPVLVLIGAMMMGEAGKIDWENMSNAVPAFLTIVMMPFTYSITNGMVFGLVSAFGFYITTGQMFMDIKDAIGSNCCKQGTDEESASLLNSSHVSPKRG